MHRAADKPQRIAQLAPLADVLAALESRILPVPPVEIAIDDALGKALAADIAAAEGLPAAATAVRDGWAVASNLVADAGTYAPAPLPSAPPWMEAGGTLPAGCDAVLPADAVIATAAGFEAVAAAAPGEGAVPAGFDASPGARLVPAGRRLRAADIAALACAGIRRVSVRAPRIGIVAANPAFAAGEDRVGQLIAVAVVAEGGTCAEGSAHLARAFAAPGADALITIGGTGEGRNDGAVQRIAAAGEVLFHGMAIRPGETAGLGIVAGKPALMLPGRLDAALAAWLLVGRRLLARLAGATEREAGASFPLARKVTSTVGLAEVVLVERCDGGIRPIAGGQFPLHAIGNAAGWLLVPPESEGYPSGATVEVHPLP